MEKNSAVKFSPLGTTGEIGEILPLAKISRYTVIKITFKLPQDIHITMVHPSHPTYQTPQGMYCHFCYLYYVGMSLQANFDLCKDPSQHMTNTSEKKKAGRDGYKAKVSMI